MRDGMERDIIICIMMMYLIFYLYKWMDFSIYLFYRILMVWNLVDLLLLVLVFYLHLILILVSVLYCINFIHRGMFRNILVNRFVTFFVLLFGVVFLRLFDIEVCVFILFSCWCLSVLFRDDRWGLLRVLVDWVLVFWDRWNWRNWRLCEWHTTLHNDLYKRQNWKISLWCSYADAVVQNRSVRMMIVFSVFVVVDLRWFTYFYN